MCTLNKICLKCSSDLFFLSNLPIELLKELPIKKMEFNNSIENNICLKCQTKIDGYYIHQNKKEEFLCIIAKYISNHVSNLIGACERCTMSRDYTGEDGEASWVADLIEDNFGTVSQEILDLIDSKFKLICSSCVGGIYTYRNPEDSFTIPTYEKHYTDYDCGDIWATNFSMYADKVGIKITETEILEFESSLRENLMLAYKSEVGQKIYQLVEKKLLEKDKNIMQASTLYRGRMRKRKEDTFLPEKMWEPPYQVASQGRFNLSGISVLYLTDDINAIPFEVNFTKGNLVDIGIFKTKDELNILDISVFYEGHYLTMKMQETTDILAEEYLLSSYIALCARELGFDGVTYPCVANRKYTNYVLFSNNRYFNYGDYSKYLNMLDLVEIQTWDFEIKYNKNLESVSFNKDVIGLVQFIKEKLLQEKLSKDLRYESLRKAISLTGDSDLSEELEFLINKANQ